MMESAEDADGYERTIREDAAQKSEGEGKSHDSIVASPTAATQVWAMRKALLGAYVYDDLFACSVYSSCGMDWCSDRLLRFRRLVLP